MSDQQAVVIIHGIGEQKPMDTLRSFVESIRGYLVSKDESERNTVIRSKPDGVSETYETRRLTLSQSQNRPRTDFYEFYWAHNMRNTLFTHTIPWLRRLIFTRPNKIPARLRPIWWTVWVLIVASVAIAYLVANNKWLAGLVAALTAIPVILTVVGILQKLFSSAFLSTAGDAARYFNPIPSNIEERNKIRQQGIAFLEKLHEKGYSRIILVGHSLGSVIGYDLLRLLWTKYHTGYEKKIDVDQDYIERLNKTARRIELLSDINLFQDLQYQCWEELKNTGNAWRVSDFISLGAAVCCSDYFLGTTTPFNELVQQLEYPICPPVTDGNPGSEQKGNIFFHQRYDISDKPRSIKLLHHSALFAVVRWTNIFFTTDFIGSRGDRVFGKGVKDIPIDRWSPYWFLPVGHTHYWDIKENEALKEIAAALKLRPDNNPKLESKKSRAEAAKSPTES